MKHKVLTLALAALTLPSCDKAKSLVGKASSAVSSELAKHGDTGSTTPDPALQKLVDQTSEGVIFRKDLPFPARIEVKLTRIEELSVRTSESSAIEKSSKQMTGTKSDILRFERSANQVRYTRLGSNFVEAGVTEEKKAEIQQKSPPSKTLAFVKSGNHWISDGGDFLSASLSKTLSPLFDGLLIENALAPHALWFAKRRFKVGDELTVTGETLPMLISGKATGSFSLTLESFEAVAGHPCGVFKITGDYNRRQVPDFDGVLTDQDVTIQSGKLWLSLIYPLILREETDTVQTLTTGGRGNLTTHRRGSVKVSVVRDWKVTGN